MMSRNTNNTPTRQQAARPPVGRAPAPDASRRSPAVQGASAPERHSHAEGSGRPVVSGGARRGAPAVTYPTTLAGLLAEAQRQAESGACQDEIIEYLYAAADRYGIRVRHDQHDLTATSAVQPSGAPELRQDLRSKEGEARSSKEARTPTPGPAPAKPEPATEPTPTPTDEQKEGDGGPARAKGKRQPRSDKAPKGKPATVTAPVIRMPDGSHKLAIGRLFDPDVYDDQAAPRRGESVGRLVLSGDKRGGGAARGRSTPLYYECNGLVVDARSWRPLAVPPSAFNPRPSARVVDPLLAEGLYDVIRVDDGTVVTLYHWEHPSEGGSWALASSNGYDVSSLYWIGPLTYAEVFFDIAQKLYPEFGKQTGMTLERRDGATRLQFTALDRTRCYTVGFRHHNFHPMTADPERMWQIQCTDLSGEHPRVVYDTTASGAGLPAIPAQTVYADLAVLAARASAALEREAEARGGSGPEPALDGAPRPLTLGGLQALGRGALDAATRHVASKGLTPAVGALPAELNYGYILRTRDPARTGENSDLLVETPLLSRIRKITYERAPRSVRDELTADDRLEYNALRAYLTPNERSNFLALYPQWAPRFQAFEEFVNNVINLVIHALRQRSMAPANREPTLRSPTGQVARALLDHINRYEQLAPFEKDTRGVITDYVVNPEYAFLFLRAMRSAVNTLTSAPSEVVRASLQSPGPAENDAK